MISDSEEIKNTPYKDILYVLQKTQYTQNSIDLEPIKSITPNDKANSIKVILTLDFINN